MNNSTVAIVATLLTSFFLSSTVKADKIVKDPKVLDTLSQASNQCSTIFRTGKWKIERARDHGTYISVKTNKGLFEIDKKSGFIFYTQLYLSEYSSPPASKEECINIGTTFLKQLNIYQDQWNLWQCTYDPSGQDIMNCRIEYYRYDSFVKLPSRVLLNVNPHTKTVCSFRIDDDAIKTPLKWNISEQKSIEIAKKNTGFKNNFLIQSDLQIPLVVNSKGFFKTEDQCIAWEIIISDSVSAQGYARFCIVTIDANTGEILDIGRSGGAGSVKELYQSTQERKNRLKLGKIPPRGKLSSRSLSPTLFQQAQKKKKFNFK
jgi:hypothetical protein